MDAHLGFLVEVKVVAVNQFVRKGGGLSQLQFRINSLGKEKKEDGKDEVIDKKGIDQNGEGSKKKEEQRGGESQGQFSWKRTT